MSRIGRKPVPVPPTVKVSIADSTIQVEGPKGKLELHATGPRSTSNSTRPAARSSSAGTTTSGSTGRCTA